ALEVAAGEHGHGGEYSTGIAGYDAWIRALRDGDLFVRDETAGFGLAYNAACWAECRRMAASFLREAQRRLGDSALDAHFDQATESYATVAQEMGRVTELFPFDVGAEVQMAARARDAARRAEAVGALRAARAAEAAGLGALGRIVAALGSDETFPAPSGQRPEAPGGVAQSGGGVSSGALQRVLVGVPKVAYHTDRWRFTPFITSLDACLRFLGEEEQYD
ncbi:unnamed protein product, partial [marine sediment metagenome]